MEVRSLLATAIAGRPLPVVDDADGAVWTDGELLHVPSDGDHHLAVFVQSLLVASGGLEPRAMTRLLGRTEAGRRYVTLEAARAAEQLRDVLPPWVLHVLDEHWSGELTTSARGSVDRALRDSRVPLAPAEFGALRPRKVMRARPGASDTDHEVVDFTAADLAGLSEEDEVDDEDADEASSALHQEGMSSGSRMSKWMRDLLGLKRTPQPDGGDGANQDTPVGAISRDEGRGRVARVMSGVSEVLAGEPSRPLQGSTYPEWDHRRSAYRPGWCSVIDLDPAAAADPYERVADGHLRRRLARVSLTYERHRRQADGDALDISALVDFAVDRATGDVGDGLVYEASLRTARDLGVLVLLDASGSTADGTGGTSAWDEHRAVATRLAAAFEEIGDRVSVYAFSSRGRQVRFLRVMDFEGRLDGAALRRLGSLEPSGFTRLGAAVRHGTNVLATTAGTTRLLLVLVSDGLPYDDGYEGAYAEHDTRHALTEAAHRGVACACISVATAIEDASLDRLWGGTPHLRLADASDLHHHVEPLFRAALSTQARSGRGDLLSTSSNARGHAHAR